MLSKVSASNIIGWINSTGTANAGKQFQVRKWSTHAELFAVHEDGTVTLHGPWQDSDTVALENTTSGSVDVLSLKKDGAEKLVIAYDSSAGEVHLRTGINGSTDHHLQLRSASDVVFVLAGATPTFTIVDHAGTVMYQIDHDGTFSINKSGTPYAKVAYSGGDVEVLVGVPEAARGRITIADDTTPGDPGYIVLESRDVGTESEKICCLWVSSGKLMIAKGSSPTGGYVAGDQRALW